MEGHAINPWILFGMSMLVVLGLSIFSVLGTRRLDKIPTSRRQGILELVVESLNNFVVGIVGPGGEKYTPFIGVLFIYILLLNLLGLVPGFHSPTGDLNAPLSLALIVFVIYNYYGVRAAGLLSYLKHLVGEPLWLAPLMLPIHVIGELARPVSLSIRLFGNVFGKETILIILAGMTYVAIPYVVALPTQFPMAVFAVFISFVQALVFATLSCIYIAMAISGHEEYAAE